MRRRILSAVALFSAVILAVTCALYSWEKSRVDRDVYAMQIIGLNEIDQLAEQGETELLAEKTEALLRSLRGAQMVSDEHTSLFVLCGICIVFLFAGFGYVYVYVWVLRPFEKMKSFARKIAQGNFDVPLDYERSNYFGDFTWAFDSMRREITKARACEKEAIDNNKTVIATLSHDIKTPLASIRAYAEGLEANLDGTPERRARYLNVLMRKCDEVTRLTDDLFLHSLADLDRLKICKEKMELGSFVEQMVSEVAGERQDVSYTAPDLALYVMADWKRLTQIGENLINNARKYAKTRIDVSITQADGYAAIHFRDYGPGIPDADMPFILDKFYRGKNCGEEAGSGLGLYIVNYIIQQLGGEVLLHNRLDGLEVTVSLPLCA